MARGDAQVDAMIREARRKEKTISAGQMFAVTTTVDEGRLEQMKKAPEIAQQVMAKVAFTWHSGLLPKHFLQSAHGEYGYAQRTRAYLRRKGARPDLTWSGAMKAELLAKASAVKKGKSGVELKFGARVLNFVPNSANPLDMFVKLANGNNYPNTKREIKMVTDVEKALLAQQASQDLADAFRAPEERV